MKRVFTAYNLNDAYLVKTLLEAEGITAAVRNEFLLRGQATPDGLPSVWITDDSQFDRAVSITTRYADGESPSDMGGSVWQCLKCGEMHEPQFSTCWKCGADHSVK